MNEQQAHYDVQSEKKVQHSRRENRAITAFSAENNDTANDTIVSLAVSDLAEAVGFEPTSPCGLPDFESGPL